MKLTEAVKKKGFVACIEAVPPEDPNLEPLLEYVASVRELVDFVNVSDAPGKKFTMSALYAAHRIKEAALAEPILHVNCRDYNRRAIAGILLAATSSGISNVLAVTGDRSLPGEVGPVDVFDVKNSVELIEFAKQRLGGALCLGCVANPTVEEIEAEVAKTARKLAAGAEFVQTQPVYDLDVLKAFIAELRKRGFRAPVVCGVLPLKGMRNAEFLERKLGIRVPDGVKQKVRGRGLEGGTEVAIEVALGAREVCEGVIVFTLGKKDIAAAARKVLEALPATQ